MKAPATLPFYLYDFGTIQPDSFLQGDSFKLLEGVQTERDAGLILIEQSASYHEKGLAWLEETKSALCT